MLRMDKRTGFHLPSAAIVLIRSSRVVVHPPGTPWNNGYIESFNNRLRRECLNRNHWTNLLETRTVIGDFKHESTTPVIVTRARAT